jgi:adenylate kinase
MATLFHRYARFSQGTARALVGSTVMITVGVALDTELLRHRRKIEGLLVLDVDEEEIVRRISGRLVCPNGHTWHATFTPPAVAGVCDTCGEPLTRRPDDEPDVVRNRYRNVYLAETEPVRGHYEALGTPEAEVDGTGAPDDVYGRLRRAVDEL